MTSPPKYLLPVIVFSQFAGTSLWFAGNAIISNIQSATSAGGLANITSIVQFGFIAGTLIFSLLTIADRFPAPKVFFFSSLIAATTNLLLIWTAMDTTFLYSFRFITGFFLAGIYPVGMKIAADWFPGKLGNALGFLVGALVLGTAFPHILKSELQNFQWQYVLIFTSLLAFIGGLLILLFVPHLKKNSANKIYFKAAFSVFSSANFRSAAFGYFGHMWELYAFWAFVPLLIKFYNDYNHAILNVPLWSFIIIASGCAGCIAGGILSKTAGSKNVAFFALFMSCICCLCSFFIFNFPAPFFLIFLLAWGITVVTDSPQFSTMVAQSAPAENKGTALTIATSIGFAMTIVSVQILKLAFDTSKQYGLVILSIGPILGLISLKKYLPVNTGR